MRELASIPHLFPARLLDISLSRVLGMVAETGTRVERMAMEDSRSSRRHDRAYEEYRQELLYPSSLLSRAWPEWLTTPPPASHFTGTKVFLHSAQICREFLSIFLAGPVLDSLSEEARKVADPQLAGHTFTFTVLCGDRLGRLVIHQHADLLDARNKAWAQFLSSGAGTALTLSCLSQLASLSSLYLHYVATNDMLYVVSNTCSRLVLLDISYSHKVTDIGLVHLCGMLRGPGSGSPRGCRYLRELYFNPQSTEPVAQEPIMPRVISCLLRHLPMLQVVDLPNLHPGIEHYYRGTAGESTHRQARVKPLQLIHYTGSDKLAEVMDICPKLRTFKLFVTELLPDLGYTLQGLNHSLDLVTLVYARTHTTLTGFQEFLSACGQKISRLEVECTQETTVTAKDLTAIATCCPQLESLAFSNFKVDAEVDHRVSHSPVPTRPASFPFLTSARFCNVYIEQYGKDVFRYLLGGAHDLESLNISFHAAGYFFSDFLLDDILLVNELAHLEEFILQDGALTLISALRLISSKPKLKTIGRLRHWDVEPSELETFIQILRKAKSLNLLHDINIV